MDLLFVQQRNKKHQQHECNNKKALEIWIDFMCIAINTNEWDKSQSERENG